MNRITFAVKSALGLAMLAPTALVFAQTTPAAQTSGLEEVVVTGIRQSVQQSLDAKRAANEVVEVVTAEDIGKMPDKNVADSLTRVSGVTTSSASANEGGFDENDRVSMRGTNPSLTQTLINGHGVAAGDWFVLNQVQQVGRSVSYTLLPSELVSQVVVHKSSQASLVEGGVAGSIDIITRKPLDFKNPLTFQISAGAVSANLPSKTDGQYNGLFNWKSNGGNFGVLVQAFWESRHLRRDGVELLGYEKFDPSSPVVTTHPDLANVYYPALIGAAFFEQKRERKGGLIDFEFKPSDDVTVDLSAFASKLEAANYNRNYLLWMTHFVNRGFGQGPDDGYTVTNGTLTQANFSGNPGTLYGVYDQISRPDESATSNFVNLDVAWRSTDALSFTGQLGTSQGDGKTPTQNVSETDPGTGMGAGYSLHGINSGPDFNLGATNNTTPFAGGVPVDFNWIFGAQNVDVKDKETWAKIDGDFKVGDDSWTDFKFGARYQSHERSSLNALAQGPTFWAGGGADKASYPSTWSNYPSNFNSFGGSIPTDIWYWTPAQLATYNTPCYLPLVSPAPLCTTGQTQRNPTERAYYQYWFGVKEKDTAIYGQMDFKGTRWAANVGVRVVRTQEEATTYTQVPANYPGAITGSLFGTFAGIPVEHTYTNVLESANLKVDLRPDLVARFAAASTMTRADYSALAGFTDLSPPGAVGGTGTGTGGNPDLKPILSNNLDAGLEWYFAKRSLLSAGLFYMDLQNYVTYGSQTLSYFTIDNLHPQGAMVPYQLSVPVNATGRVQGLELAYQQALGENFGVAANYTYADGKQTSLVTNGDDRLVGTSKNTYNLSTYFENTHFSARLTYTYRSAFFSGLDRNTAFSQDAIGGLAASFAYTLNDNLSFSLDGQNLNNPTLKYYALNSDQPRAFYKNGQQYYFTVRFKM